MDIEYAQVKDLLNRHSALKLLRAEHAALLCRFFDEVFVSSGALALPESELISQLSDLLARINDPADPEIKRDAKALIKDWSAERLQFLRRFTQDTAARCRHFFNPAFSAAQYIVG